MEDYIWIRKQWWWRCSLYDTQHTTLWINLCDASHRTYDVVCPDKVCLWYSSLGGVSKETRKTFLVSLVCSGMWSSDEWLAWLVARTDPSCPPPRWLSRKVRTAHSMYDLWVTSVFCLISLLPDRPVMPHKLSAPCGVPWEAASI